MPLRRCFAVVFMSMIMGFGLGCNDTQWGLGLGQGFYEASVRTITVDQQGKGDFITIQSAIDSIPSNNDCWVLIYVRRGTYGEKVTIPPDKPYVALQGEGMKITTIVWEDHDDPEQSATFSSLADNFVARHISFRNSYNNYFGHNRNARTPAVAARVFGDKSSFYSCGFFGLQDTLWDVQGRHYFKSCFIEGAVDFIFGSGQSIYEKCKISVIAHNVQPVAVGFITAQARSSSTDPSAFIFKHCSVFGRGSAYLGRAWRAYSRVLFFNTFLSQVVHPQGWDAWGFTGHEGRITFAEYGCKGRGSNTSQRVKWKRKLNHDMVAKFISTSFIDKDGWLKWQMDQLFRSPPSHFTIP
ncbi:hypothetical protein GIB67_001317 [Kingdonia uniflora]|uniref:Pectinesterase n=1 Tax=Kingdonia uniflora TaxID=39325 RepID=A0A7J7LL89_9MAGN|nr:hypothetical protein GIB67_001317 [Kingdonia uniflora]